MLEQAYYKRKGEIMNMLIKYLFVLTSFSLAFALNNPEDLYLDLMKKCLINSIYADISYWHEGLNALAVSGTYNYNQNMREDGRDHPSVAHTMIGLKRLNNIQFCVEDVLKNNIPGDLIETGVWRGGATIFMRAILKTHKSTNRTVWVADSFEGLPAPNPKDYPADTGINLNSIPYLAVSLETVKANFKKYDLLDHQVKFLKGWFKDTLPHAPIRQLAVLRLDGDLYESTMDTLKYLYPKLSIGGYIIIDDFSIAPCRQAVADYRAKHNITEPIQNIDGWGVFWKRTK